MRMTTNHGSTKATTASSANASTSGAPKSLFTEGVILRKFPLWKTLDDKVLRFFGFFSEKVGESMTERNHDMVHKVVVLFFLGDRSMQVSERPSGPNTGLKAGIIMSKFYDHGQEPLHWNIGDVVTLRGRNITIADCDAFTRDFFKTLGRPLSDDQGSYPDEYFEQTMLQTGGLRRKNALDDEDYKQGRRAAETLAVVAKQMPAPRFMSAEEKRNAAAFLLHDREVLNFFAVWEKRHFRISYFLSDGTMCVNFLKSANDGRDPVANFLKRGKITKGAYTLKSIDTVAAPRQVAQDPYTEDDFSTGITLNIMGRDFFLYDCDEFTRQHYLKTKGIELEAHAKPRTEGDDQNPHARRPQLDRTEEIQRKREALKAPLSDQVLRFAAVIESEVPQDQGRQFVFCFFCSDNTVAVYELPVRNSGHVGGKIFTRAKVDTVTRDQVHEGALIRLGGRNYRLIDSDDRTKAADVPRSPPGAATIESRATDILDRLRQQISQRWSRVSDAYLHFNTSKRGIALSDLRNMLRECEIRTTSHDEPVVARVMERVDRDEDGVISLQEFVSNILRQSLVGGTTADTVTSSPSKAAGGDNNNNLPPMQAGASLRLAKLDAERQRQQPCKRYFRTFYRQVRCSSRFHC